MTKVAEEAVRLIDSLPPSKARAVLEYARSLVEREPAKPRHVPNKRLAELKGFVDVGGDALEDCERLYHG